jgi:CPA2 family monovalent cation:H+ antiporter-2
VLGVSAAIILTKAALATGALIVAGAPARIAITAGVGLAQVGEFSFILGRSGLDAGLLPQGMWQVMLAASVTTMMVTPALLAAAPVVAAGLRRLTSAPVTEAGIPQLSGHVIVLGFGVGGQLVARALQGIGVPYLILELNGATVQRARAEGERIFYGDATSEESLRAAGVEHALAVVSLLSDPDAARRMVTTVRRISPGVSIVVRTRYRLEAERLQEQGATVAVAEELEASLEVVAQLLSRLHVAGNVIEPLLDVFRRELVSLRPLHAPQSMLESLPASIRQMPVSTHRVEPGQWAIGRSVAEINLRASTGASVLAIVRGDRSMTPPTADERIEEADVLYLLGDDSDVLLARQLLTRGAV